ncbi:MAG: hypothetical protein A2498_05935 [Lentisphaerae bacterium RIFOXYC12_FULL_60_16]|nr:MAG: hypothetical protein A2498_05935 [Lentisphaerae bacterium RIFOXYC12_FULL_60_16]OGV75240.1 MAG: hypothetical protein A2340_00435 [Lentisphaerae bacterium RIFOXYB12_FULL_60_10]
MTLLSHRILSGTVACLFLQGSLLFAASRYVSNTGGDSTHDSWLTAYTNLQEALSGASSGDVIHVAGQLFQVPTQINWTVSHLTFKGGYAGNEVGGLPGERDPDRWTTVITRTAGATTRLLYVNGISQGVLDGVTLSGGYITEQYGSGLYVNNSALTVTNCVIRANRINHASGAGAGLAVINGGVRVTESVIDLNVTQGGTHLGSGIYINNGTHSVEHSVIANNYSLGTSFGDGLYIVGATANMTVFNSLITGNHRDGVHVQTAGAVAGIVHSTITGHSRYGLNRVAGTVTVENSILWGNNADILGTVTASYCLLGAGTAGIGSNGNITGDPLFECGLYLGNGSPAIDLGNGTAGLSGLTGRTTRLSGAVDDGVVDIGYHFIPGIPAGAANRYAAYDSGLSDIYVSPAGDDGNGGMTVGDAFRSITRALAVAGTGSRIHVAAGNYTNGVETFPIQMTRYGVQLLGAGAGTTVVNAAGSGTRALQTIGLAGGGARIEGITFTGGSVGTTTAYSSYTDDHFGARRGGGLNLVNSVMVLEGLVVTNNNVSPGGNDAAFT